MFFRQPFSKGKRMRPIRRWCSETFSRVARPMGRSQCRSLHLSVASATTTQRPVVAAAGRTIEPWWLPLLLVRLSPQTGRAANFSFRSETETLVSTPFLRPGAAGSDGRGTFRRTSVNRFIGAQKRYSAREAVDFVSEVDLKNEDIFSDGGLDGSIEWNLLGDPSGGLNDSDSAEELSEQDLVEEIQSRQNRYAAEQYYLLFTPLVDIISLMVDHQLLPENERKNAKAHRLRQVKEEADDEPEEETNNTDSTATAASTEGCVGPRPKGSRSVPDIASRAVAHWFLDGQSALARPTWTEEKMGSERYAKLVAALKEFYEPVEGVMPLTRVVRRHRLPEEVFVPFLRQLSLDMYASEHRAATVKAVPGVIITLANGRAVPKSLGLPDNDEERVFIVTALFMAVAHESGNTDLAYLGIQLLRAHGISVPFTFQKQLTNVFSTASRIMTDWRVRSSGVLAECLPKWRDYLRKVKVEVRGNWARTQRLSQELDMEDAAEDMSAMPTLTSSSTKRTANKKDRSRPVEGSPKSSEKHPASAMTLAHSSEVAHYFGNTDYLNTGGSPSLRALEANIRDAAEARVLYWSREPAAIRKGRRSKVAMEEEALMLSLQQNAATAETSGKTTTTKERK